MSTGSDVFESKLRDRRVTDLPSWVSVAAAVGGASIVAASSFAGQWFRARVDRHERVQTEARDERHAVYKRLVGMLRQGGLQRMNNLAEGADVLIYASDEVVRAWGNMIHFVVYEGGAKHATPRTIELWGELLLAMRRDAGRAESRLSIDETMRALGIDRGRDWQSLVEKTRAAEASAPPERDDVDYSG